MIGNGKPGPVTSRLKRHFEDVVHGRVEHRKNWLTPVWADQSSVQASESARAVGTG
jgi:hypothetical protein